MAQLTRDDSPPKREGELWVERLKGSRTKKFTLYSTKIWGVWTHWNGKKSMPCVKPECECAGCVNKQPKRWKAYLHAYDHARRCQVFLELTPTATRSLLEQIGRGVSLRGATITVTRTSSDKGRLLVQVNDVPTIPSMLPEVKDPLKTLLDFWEIAEEPTGMNHGPVMVPEQIPAVA